MKAILKSLPPKQVKNILNGNQTIIICKTAPKCDLPIDVYLYCAYGEGLIDYYDEILPLALVNKVSKGKSYGNCVNGKVVAKFSLKEISIIECSSDAHNAYSKATCLTQQDFIDYCNGQDLYARHISDLQIFDKPMELGEFGTWCKNYVDCEIVTCYKDNCRQGFIPLTRPPQGWQYVEIGD